MPDVFISYNREDRDMARLVAGALEAEGFSVWWDAALRAGETYDEVTEHNLRTSGAVVVLWSKKSSNSKWVRAEATVGERSSTLVPALIEDCDRPIRFELVQTADLRHWRGDRNDPSWRAFMQDVRSAVQKKSSKQQAQAPANAAPAVAPDASIETAFWNSIKDGGDRAEYEAYLKRYPNGYFAALAQNRIAALSRPAAARPAPQSPPPSSAPQHKQAAPPPRQPAPQPANNAPPRKSGGGLIYAGIAAAIVVLCVVGFLMMPGRGDAPAQAAAPDVAIEKPAETPVAVTEQETTPGEDFVDVFADAAADALPTEDIAAIDIEGAPLDLAAETGSAPAEPPSAPQAVEPVVSDAAKSDAALAAVPAATATPKKVKPGKTFRDCESCPQMTALPAGTFVMGSPSDEPGRNAYEGPQRTVAVPAFAIGVYEITAAEWAACAADGVCTAKAVGDGKGPALNISFREAETYASWLTRKTGRKYRMPTEAEWEYAARAGTTTAYWWGDRYDASNVATREPKPVGSAKANAFGVHDMLGNAREWVADCYVNNFLKAPIDGAAVTEGDCSKRVIRGGAWSSSAADMRVANRSRIDVNGRAGYMGVRIAAEVK